jgi:hypothetical protein
LELEWRFLRIMKKGSCCESKRKGSYVNKGERKLTSRRIFSMKRSASFFVWKVKTNGMFRRDVGSKESEDSVPSIFIDVSNMIESQASEEDFTRR